MKKSEKIGLFILVISVSFNAFMLPQSPGNFYAPAHYSNLFLPNFGFDSSTSILPYAFKTLTTQYSFLKVFLEIIGDILAINQILYFFSPILAFFAFILFFSIIPDFIENRTFLSSILSMFFNWNAIALILGMCVLFFTSNLTKRVSASLISFTLIFVTLAFYWHSAHILFLFQIVSLLIFLIYFKKTSNQYNKKMTQKYIKDLLIKKLLLVILISIFVWAIIRETPIFANIFKISYYLDPSIITKGLFSKGSFIPLEYQYTFDFFVPVLIVDMFRYLAYFITFCIFSLYFIKMIIFKHKKLKIILATSLLFGSICFMFNYFIATETIGPAPINIFLIPFILGLCLIYVKSSSNKRKLTSIVVFSFLIFSSFLSISYQKYEMINNSLEFQSDFKMYESCSMWLANNLYGKTVISDANTVGYISIWYNKNNYHCNNPLFFYSIGESTYHEIYQGNYNSHSSVIVYNYVIYQKHLVFESLQSWNKFKPLAPGMLQRNNLDVLYNDGNIWVLTK